MKDIKINATITGAISGLSYDQETRALTNEYYELTGKVYPAFNGAEWPSPEEWYADLKIAVYRERTEPTKAGKPVEICDDRIRLLYEGHLYTEDDIEMIEDGVFSIRNAKAVQTWTS